MPSLARLFAEGVRRARRAAAQRGVGVWASHVHAERRSLAPTSASVAELGPGSPTVRARDNQLADAHALRPRRCRRLDALQRAGDAAAARSRGRSMQLQRRCSAPGASRMGAARGQSASCLRLCSHAGAAWHPGRRSGGVSGDAALGRRHSGARTRRTRMRARDAARRRGRQRCCVLLCRCRAAVLRLCGTCPACDSASGAHRAGARPVCRPRATADMRAASTAPLRLSLAPSHP
jgi:hypothetical protein